jgi:hypothetical protein
MTKMHRCSTIECSLIKKKEVLNRLLAERVVDDGKVINIGVVFNICYSGISLVTAELEADFTIKQLNKDYNKKATNFDSGKNIYRKQSLKNTYLSYLNRSGAANLNFFKVQTRLTPLSIQSSEDITTLDINIKHKYPPINPDQYLNVWVVDLNNGLLGYAQFPWDVPKTTDGVVIAKGTFGRNPEYSTYNLGHTLTHESGHWFGLYHTFQETFNYDGGNIDYTESTSVEELKGDCVIDTPPQLNPTEGNPYKTPNSWPASKPIDERLSYRHMFINFMDYSDDLCMFMFTMDQVNKLRQMIYLYRPKILETVFPVPTPVPNKKFPLIIKIGFENSTKEGWQLINPDKKQIDSNVSDQGTLHGAKALRTRKKGRARIEVDLDGAIQATLTINVRALNNLTYIWVKDANNVLYYKKIAKRKNYRKYILTLPGPFNQKYLIQFGTNGTDMIYSYWDDIQISAYDYSTQIKVPKTVWKKRR